MSLDHLIDVFGLVLIIGSAIIFVVLVVSLVFSKLLGIDKIEQRLDSLEKFRAEIEERK
jgi:hypothetical protein